MQTEYTYDDAQRLDEITVTGANTPVLLHSLDYDWTPDGLVSSIGVVEGPDSYTVNFSYDLRSRLLREWSTDGPASRDYDLSYTYDQVGNRLTKTDNLSEPDIVTTYTYDVHDATPAATYGSFNNRLMSHKVEQGAAVLEETWYAYNFGGQIRRIVTEYPQTPWRSRRGSHSAWSASSTRATQQVRGEAAHDPRTQLRPHGTWPRVPAGSLVFHCRFPRTPGHSQENTVWTIHAKDRCKRAEGNLPTVLLC